MQKRLHHFTNVMCCEIVQRAQLHLTSFCSLLHCTTAYITLIDNNLSGEKVISSHGLSQLLPGLYYDVSSG